MGSVSEGHKVDPDVVSLEETNSVNKIVYQSDTTNSKNLHRELKLIKEYDVQTK